MCNNENDSRFLISVEFILNTVYVQKESGGLNDGRQGDLIATQGAMRYCNVHAVFVSWLMKMDNNYCRVKLGHYHHDTASFGQTSSRGPRSVKFTV